MLCDGDHFDPQELLIKLHKCSTTGKFRAVRLHHVYRFDAALLYLSYRLKIIWLFCFPGASLLDTVLIQDVLCLGFLVITTVQTFKKEPDTVM